MIWLKILLCLRFLTPSSHGASRSCRVTRRLWAPRRPSRRVPRLPPASPPLPVPPPRWERLTSCFLSPHCLLPVCRSSASSLTLLLTSTLTSPQNPLRVPYVCGFHRFAFHTLDPEEFCTFGLFSTANIETFLSQNALLEKLNMYCKNATHKA